MIETIEVRNFQSLRSVDLEIGRFTVIVGPSSSGKSALMRAIKTLASNSRGVPYISHGAKSASVMASTERGRITLERSGKATDSYTIVDETGKAARFTKLAGSVPPEVSAFLGIDPISDDQSLQYASQFDRPYLLTDSGASVAAKLGQLTNVSVLFEVSREATRLKSEAARSLKVREADAEALKATLSEFRNLPAQVAALEAAEALATKLEALSNARARLERTIETLEIAEAALDSAERTLGRLVEVDVDLAPVYALKDQRVELSYRIDKLERLTADAELAERNLELQLGALQDAKDQYTQALSESGFCPLCGSDSQHYHPERVI